MKFLIDTNVLIPLEPTGLEDIHPATPGASMFARVAAGGRHQLYVHPAMQHDIARDGDRQRRDLRELLFRKYLCLETPPCPGPELIAVLGAAEPTSRDWVDNQLLAAVAGDAADFLVTEDGGIREKARRLGLQDRVTTVAEATSVLEDLFEKSARPPPAVHGVLAYRLNGSDPIFDSFRQDYPGFDLWLAKCKRQHRQAWVIDGGESRLAAVCIVKRENGGDFGLSGKVLKICTFKVAQAYNGFRFGELLLKTVFDHVQRNGYDSLYVTVFEKQGMLLALLKEFGFIDVGARTELGEIVLVKRMSFSQEHIDSLDPLSFNVRFGPHSVKIEGVPTFAVPIKPLYHRVLFPEAEQQAELWPGSHPFGNSIRKAYLSHAGIRTIAGGAALLFYRSGDIRGVTAVGVAEGALVSGSAKEVARYVGKRTVYSYRQIRSLCRRQVLALLFRQAQILKAPILLADLVAHGVLKGAPQSIVQIPREATAWLQTRLGA